MGAYRVPDYFRQQGRNEEEEDRSTMTKNLFLLEVKDPKGKKDKGLLETSDKLEPPPLADSRRNSQNTATFDAEKLSLPLNTTAKALIPGAYCIRESSINKNDGINTIYQYKESFWAQEQQRQQQEQQKDQPNGTNNTTVNLDHAIGYDNDVMKGKQEKKMCIGLIIVVVVFVVVTIILKIYYLAVCQYLSFYHCTLIDSIRRKEFVMSLLLFANWTL